MIALLLVMFDDDIELGLLLGSVLSVLLIIGVSFMLRIV
jgi:hypothetical protein